MDKELQLAQQPFIPVILGGNLGAYAIARSFHEEYEVNSIIISAVETGPVKNSAIIYNWVEPNMQNEDILIKQLKRIENRYPGLPKLLIGSDDWHVEIIVAIRGHFGDEWTIPYITEQLFNELTDKSLFYRLCDQIGVDCPRTIAIDCSDMATMPAVPFPFPVVLKPSKSVDYVHLQFEGKMKAYILHTEAEWEETLSLVVDAGFKGIMLAQEFVPGNDTAMHVLTCFSDQEGEVILSSMGQTLLEDHTPGGIGNPLAIRTVYNEKVIEQATKLLEYCRYIGFSNFDIKFDERDGTYKFFEINARLGRSNYYVTAQGNNVARYYVECFLYNRPLEPVFGGEDVLFSLVPKNLLLSQLKEEKQIIEKVESLYGKGAVEHPLRYYPADSNIHRRLYDVASSMNYYVKFKKYPAPNQ
ncbi:carbamoyl phosphate synthase-like protein [Bacillus sp. 1P06AnD]|uniref:carboxylate--amine ligase n=1 Tax=Bacillus sp. 1P06AnD TaxID=3132208 RepID=UPI0039A0ED60